MSPIPDREPARNPAKSRGSTMAAPVQVPGRMKSPGEILFELGEKRRRKKSRRPRHVVIWSPAAALRRLVANVYRADGHEADEAVEPREVFAILRRHKIDLVILDARTRAVEALETAATLRETARHVAVAIFMAPDDEATAKAAHELRAPRLTMPIDSTVLRALVGPRAVVRFKRKIGKETLDQTAF